MRLEPELRSGRRLLQRIIRHIDHKIVVFVMGTIRVCPSNGPKSSKREERRGQKRSKPKKVCVDDGLCVWIG